MADNWKEAQELAGRIWDFETDKELIGLYVSHEEKVGPNESHMYTIELQGGERVSVWGNTVLDGKFKVVPMGAEVKINYLGKVNNPKTNRQYKNFTLFYRQVVLPFDEVK